MQTLNILAGIFAFSGRGDFGGGGRGGGYDDWGKRPGDDLDGPPSRMRKMDNRYGRECLRGRQNYKTNHC